MTEYSECSNYHTTTHTLIWSYHRIIPSFIFENLSYLQKFPDLNRNISCWRRWTLKQRVLDTRNYVPLKKTLWSLFPLYDILMSFILPFPFVPSWCCVWLMQFRWACSHGNYRRQKDKSIHLRVSFPSPTPDNFLVTDIQKYTLLEI